MAISKKNYILNTVSVDTGCSSCRKPSLAAVIAAGKLHRSRRSNSTTTLSSGVATPPARSSSSDTDSDIKVVRRLGRIGGGDSVAVEKDSDDPYLDFRRSMLQMILEKEIYAKKDLKELLKCFLQLNSPYYHGIIIRAFTEIWNGVYSVGLSGGGNDEFQKDWRSRDF
ncbi:transcription repressor OFP6-like [Andrographis paniculata]|uniref:transcription repressor OFP6-like n=1 Tax=Andrographis paniculata TaxID=175694 RepID=UPI0021E7557F|nr:transcription repressor OFP6-like [Andrographis paniculata]